MAKISKELSLAVWKLKIESLKIELKFIMLSECKIQN